MSDRKTKTLTFLVIKYLPLLILERIFLSNWITKILRSAISMLLPIFLIITSVQALTTDQYLAFEYSKASFPLDSFGFTQQERFELASSDIHYVRAHLPNNTLSNQILHGTPVYNSREVSHMADVREVFQAVFRVWQITLILIALMGFVLWQKQEQRILGSAIQWGGILTSGLIVAIGLFAVFAWQSWFSTFHLFFFEKGSWLFSYSDTLIRLFPVEFWFDAVLTISVLSLAGGLSLAFLGRRAKRAVSTISG